MTPQRLREIAALLIEDAELRRGSVAGAREVLKDRGELSQALGADPHKVEAALKKITEEAEARMKAAHELQDYSFGLKGAR